MPTTMTTLNPSKNPNYYIVEEAISYIRSKRTERFDNED
jgi:hypothetical protein